MTNEPRIRVLLAEDEAHLGAILEDFLVNRGCLVTMVTDGKQALQALADQAFDVALLDIVMPEVDGLTVLRQLRAMPSPPEAIIITGNATIDTAITALKLGAYDYLSKPYRMAEIDVLVRRAHEKRQLMRENQILHDRLDRAERVREIRTQDPAMQAALALIERAAATDTAVHLGGESGTGKPLVAQALHRLSKRAAQPFVDLGAAGLTSDDLECELFGYERDAVPGARASRPGVFELANGGTVFLDNIDAIDARLQARLLRLVEQNAIYRVGGTQRIDVDVRLVTAADVDLVPLVEQRQFRSDLYYRLAAIRVDVPPLRERTADIPLLAAQFAETVAGARAPRLSEAAREALMQYSWPGNVRELRNVMERAVLLANGPVIEAHDLPLVSVVREPSVGADGSGLPLAAIERRHIESVLVQEGWHQGRAAATLGISAKTLYRKIREYGFERPRGER